MTSKLGLRMSLEDSFLFPESGYMISGKSIPYRNMDSVDIALQVATVSVDLSPYTQCVRFCMTQWKALETMGRTCVRWNIGITAFRRKMRTALQHRVHDLSFKFGPFDDDLLRGEDRQARVLHARMLFVRIIAFSNDVAAMAACCFARFSYRQSLS